MSSRLPCNLPRGVGDEYDLVVRRHRVMLMHDGPLVTDLSEADGQAKVEIFHLTI